MFTRSSWVSSNFGVQSLVFGSISLKNLQKLILPKFGLLKASVATF